MDRDYPGSGGGPRGRPGRHPLRRPESRFRQSQAAPAGVAVAGLVEAGEPVEDPLSVALRDTGTVVAGVGTPDASIVSTSGGYDNGGRHEVVFTRARTTGALLLYVDGVAAGSAIGSTASLTTPANINFGRIATATNYYQGHLDEIAIYNAVLSPAAITAHVNAAQ